MTDQPPLFVEPPWTASWPVGTKVRSHWTGNTGVVSAVDPLGRHVLIKWEQWRNEPDGYTARHSSELGLERLR